MRIALDLQRHLRRLTSQFIVQISQEESDSESAKLAKARFRFKVKSEIQQYLSTVIARDSVNLTEVSSWCIKYFYKGAELEVELYEITNEITSAQSVDILQIVKGICSELEAERALFPQAEE